MLEFVLMAGVATAAYTFGVYCGYEIMEAEDTKYLQEKGGETHSILPEPRLEWLQDIQILRRHHRKRAAYWQKEYNTCMEKCLSSKPPTHPEQLVRRLLFAENQMLKANETSRGSKTRARLMNDAWIIRRR